MAEPVGERFAPHLQLPAWRARFTATTERRHKHTHSWERSESGAETTGLTRQPRSNSARCRGDPGFASRSLAAHPDGAGGDASPSQPDGTGSQQTSLKPSKDAPWQVPNLLSSPRGKSQTSPVLPAPGREEARSSHVLEEPSPQLGDGGTERAPSVCPRAGTTPWGWGQHQRSPPGSQKPPWSLIPIPHHSFPALVLGTTMGWGIAPGGTPNVLLKPCCASANFSFLS